MRRPVFRLNSPRHDVTPIAADAIIAEAPLKQYVDEAADILNTCLGILDRLEMSHAAAHLSAAIEALPGQSALPPREREELIDRGQ